MAMISAEENWVYQYFLDPTFDEGATRSLKLAKLVTANGPKRNMGGLMSAAGFLGHAMARFPDRFEEWVTAYRKGLDGADQARRSVLWFAIALSHLEGTADLLERLEPLNALDAKEREAALQFSAVDVRQIEPNQAWMLDLLWGCYFGSADRSFILRILQCLPWTIDESTASWKTAIGKAAYWSVDSNRKNFNNIDGDVMVLLSDYPDLAVAYSEIYEAVTTFDPHTS